MVRYRKLNQKNIVETWEILIAFYVIKLYFIFLKSLKLSSLANTIIIYKNVTLVLKKHKNLLLEKTTKKSSITILKSIL